MTRAPCRLAPIAAEKRFLVRTETKHRDSGRQLSALRGSGEEGSNISGKGQQSRKEPDLKIASSIHKLKGKTSTAEGTRSCLRKLARRSVPVDQQEGARADDARDHSMGLGRVSAPVKLFGTPLLLPDKPATKR